MLAHVFPVQVSKAATKRRFRVMRAFFVTLLLILTFGITQAQTEKGVDPAGDRIRDGGNNRQPAVNGGKTDTGTGRGIDFGKGRTPTPPPVPNPYRFSVPNDVLTKAVEELMRERKLILDDAASKPERGLLVSQPYTFTKGSVVTSS